MSVNKPTASVSLDLDNKWAYLKTQGHSDWDTFPSYFDIVVPRVLEFLADRELTITFFVVGQDADLEKNHRALSWIADAGHEIGCHSFHHEPWLHLYTPEQLNDEIAQGESAIFQATGKKPVGFRGPGFSISDEVLRVLARRGYKYDGSTFPTFLGPLARTWFFLHSRFNRRQKEQRKSLFGKLSDGFQPVMPYHWHLEPGRLLEIPVTTMPVFKLPIHASYLMYLGSYSRTLAMMYIRFALWMCRMFNVEPSFLLHPTDFLGQEDDREMGFFPGMNISATLKIGILSDVMKLMQKHYDVVTMEEHASRVSETTQERSIATAISGAEAVAERDQPLVQAR